MVDFSELVVGGLQLLVQLEIHGTNPAPQPHR